MPRQKRRSSAAAANSAALPQTAPANDPEEEKNDRDPAVLEQARAACRRQGYVPTHDLCSTMGYLIGVRQRNFMPDDDVALLHQSIYNTLDRSSACRTVRDLCQIRMAIMRNFDEACNAVKGVEYHQFLQKYVERPNVLTRLHQDGCALPAPGADLNDHLLTINRKIGEAFEQLRRLPAFQGIAFDLLKKAMLYPGSLKKEEVKNLPYRFDRAAYPFGCYLNLNMPGGYNIFQGDDGFVELLYTQNHEPVPDLRCYRRSYGTPGPEKLAHFLRPEGNYQYPVFIDGAGIHTRELRFLLPLLRQLNENQLGQCILYCPHDKASLWSTWLREEQANLTLVEPREEYASQSWAQRLTADLGVRGIMAAANAAYVFITPSEEMIVGLKANGVLDKKNFFVVLAQQPSDLLLRQLSSPENFCVLEDLLGQLPAEEPQEHAQRQDMALEALRQVFPLDLPYNLQELIAKQLAPLPEPCSPQEQTTFEELLRQSLRLDIQKNGQMRLVLASQDLG